MWLSSHHGIQKTRHYYVYVTIISLGENQPVHSTPTTLHRSTNLTRILDQQSTYGHQPKQSCPSTSARVLTSIENRRILKEKEEAKKEKEDLKNERKFERERKKEEKQKELERKKIEKEQRTRKTNMFFFKLCIIISTRLY